MPRVHGGHVDIDGGGSDGVLRDPDAITDCGTDGGTNCDADGEPDGNADRKPDPRANGQPYAKPDGAPDCGTDCQPNACAHCRADTGLCSWHLQGCRFLCVHALCRRPVLRSVQHRRVHGVRQRPVRL